MKEILLSFYFFIAAIVGFATSFRIIFSKKDYEKSFFLGLFLFSLAVVSIYNFYLSAYNIKNFPDLIGITKSFIFLVAPCAFLYVRKVLFPYSVFKNYDWLHFLPFLIYFSITIMVWIGNFSSFYFVDYLSVKTNNPFSVLSLSVWLLYAFCQTMMILNYDIKNLKEKQLHNKRIINWIKHYNLMVLFLFSALFLHFFLVQTTNSIDYSCYVLISSVLVFTVYWLYFKPQLFYDYKEDDSDYNGKENIGFLASKEAKNAINIVKEFPPEKKQLYLAKLDSLFTSEKLFLQKDLMIRNIAEKTGITIHNLSNLINSEFNMHFQDYINLKRIEYFMEKINDPDWKDLSLEGMAWASGFKSRTTCFRAFIKHTGKSPSEYFKIIRLGVEKDHSYFLKQSVS
ncbi:helix-turn-helix domain-containing protein [Flavobacterium hydrophilum]|uniref:AraC family transcriptional regulator n=1 Tax=Flavobacterium hydrophilum TaxID=2211445 RepID=A0A2V4C3X3_9FLAO|nr:helix-turn-helix domain-containing protein [Flavobacterium hydrophilum]PXY46031.1 AraC family transcriptional regulator [Flavobacterium hydrophilum]